MNLSLSFILDIAIGLAFIYLILSLLASEIHELITTVLQWRAVHLKESIEGLLADNDSDAETNKSIRILANKIYENPLVKGMNQEAKGALPRLRHDITRFFRGIFSSFGKHKVFATGQTSGPSYLSADTFISSLFDTLQIHTLTHLITKFRLKEFVEDDVLKRYDLNNYKRLIESKQKISEDGQKILEDMQKLFKELTKSIRDFEGRRFTLAETIDRIAELVKPTNLEAFTDVFGDEFGNISPKKKEVLLKKLQPSLNELVQFIIFFQNRAEIESKYKEITQKLKSEATYEDLSRAIIELDWPEHIEQCLLLYAVFRTNKEFQEIAKVLEGIINKIPPLPEPLQKSLYGLAKRAQGKVESAEQQLVQFQKEAETWFDRSMERASGVYKRNAKLVAIIVGCSIAFTTNTDTIYVVNQLAKEQSLRSAVTQAAADVALTNSSNDNIDRERIDRITDNLSLPIGWSEVNLKQQRKEGNKWIKSLGIVGHYLPVWSLSVIGWLISGIAISMGASFWYDLLGKFINVKNVGKKPPESSSAPIVGTEVTTSRKL